MKCEVTIPYLDPNILHFPNVKSALKEPNGLLAAGGALSKDWLLEAYSRGIFPWYDDSQPILWWSPDPRLILIPEHFRGSKSLRKLVKKRLYKVTFNQNFTDVLGKCKTSNRKYEGTWITNEMAGAYTRLHRFGLAHSVEVWSSGSLVGGLYGIALGKVFFGESMFSNVDNASKIALFYLVLHLKEWGFELIDCQVRSEHLLSLGAIEIPRSVFLDKLNALVGHGEKLGEWGVKEALIEKEFEYNG